MFDKKNITVALFLLMTIFLVTCSDDEITPREYPRVKTLEVNNISASGARFNAEIIYPGNQKIVEYGFAWSENEYPNLNTSDKRVLADEITTGGFSAEISTTLYQDKAYYVRAYAKNGDYLVYGKQVEFLSLGSNAATIDGIYPDTGTWGDTILIKGKNFSYVKKKNQVFFKDFKSKIISTSDTIIKCLVPDGIVDESVPVYVDVSNQIAKSNADFHLTKPEIDSFLPLKGTFNDTIKIFGNNFSPIKDKNIVSFSGHKAEVVESSKTTLSIIVPTSINTRLNKIEIKLNLQSDIAKESFEILAPKIDNFSPEYASYNTIIKISGNNFSPITQNNIVIFDDNFGNVIEANRNELTVEIPFGVYENRFFKIGVTVAEQTVYSTDNFTLNAPWIKKEDVPSGGYNRAQATSFSILNKGYVGLGTRSYPYIYFNDFYKYDPIQNSWEQIADFPGEGKESATSFVIGDYAYVGIGINSSNLPTNEFFKYDPVSDTWIQIKDFPMSRSLGVGLSVKDKGYIFYDDYFDNFWSYDPLFDKWSQMPNLDMSDVGGGSPSHTGFVIGDKIYICISRNQYYTFVFEFDTNTHKWTRKTGFWSGDVAVGFSIEDKGYLMTSYGRNYEYDSQSDTWKELSRFPGEPRAYSIGFELNGKAYYGTGSAKHDFWGFNPEFE